jgi:hypothetical protein
MNRLVQWQLMVVINQLCSANGCAWDGSTILQWTTEYTSNNSMMGKGNYKSIDLFTPRSISGDHVIAKNHGSF